jgi:hypothetical protein
MGWEAERSGAIAKQVAEELKGYSCDIVKGCPDNEIAKEAFVNRTLHDYYTQGPSLFFRLVVGRRVYRYIRQCCCLRFNARFRRSRKWSTVARL